jgi:hypothetical protein
MPAPEPTRLANISLTIGGVGLPVKELSFRYAQKQHAERDHQRLLGITPGRPKPVTFSMRLGPREASELRMTLGPWVRGSVRAGSWMGADDG